MIMILINKKKLLLTEKQRKNFFGQPLPSTCQSRVREVWQQQFVHTKMARQVVVGELSLRHK